MDYDDFVRFMVAEEHKDLPCSLRYWFHVLDVDADGVLGRKDLEYFYEEQESRMVELGEETITFAELFNEMHDMVVPDVQGCFALPDLIRSKLGVQVVDALVNIRKMTAWEGLGCQKAAGRAVHLRDTKDWDVFMERQYQRLVEAEEDEAD